MNLRRSIPRLAAAFALSVGVGVVVAQLHHGSRGGGFFGGDGQESGPFIRGERGHTDQHGHRANCTPFEESSLIEALASYYARIGEWDTALELWQQAPLDQPFNREAITGVVLIHAARALVYAWEGLETVEKVKQTPTGELEMALPGNEAAILTDTEKALRKLERALQNVVPEKIQKALGLRHTR